jgi:dolichol-phosphate mannosyltransferase
MIEGRRIAVVIPAYRTGTVVRDVVNEIPPTVDRIIVVNDASPDDLAQILASISAPRLRVIRHEQNQGVGGATVTGMIAAIQEGADIIVKCDGDGQMDPADIPRLVLPIARGLADHVKGSRYHHARALGSMPRWRFIGNIGLTFLTKLSSGYWNVLDPVNGFFATRADVLSRLPLRKLSRTYFFETDLLVRLNIVEARVADMPQPARYGSEKSSLSVTHALFGFPPRLFQGFVRRLFWRYLFYDVSAVAIFAVLGFILTLFGMVFGLWNWIANAVQGQTTPAGTVLIAVAPIIVGFQLLLEAVILDIANTPRPELRTTELIPRVQSYASAPELTPEKVD